ncbi:phospholipid phosphatase 4 isoform X3 [Equus przewalskii]|uniref:Phospholipid phosphatase 4 isoform X3 n=1 Tax=Equus przewalskii TaxID=9798 RepID=A0ABM4LLQ4_EQUPR
MRELAIEIGVRALLFGVFVFTEFLDPFQRVIQPEEIWLYKNPLVQSDNIPTRLMFAISFLTPLAVICVVKIIRRTDKTEIKEAFLAVSLALALNGVCTNTIKLIVGSCLFGPWLYDVLLGWQAALLHREWAGEELAALCRHLAPVLCHDDRPLPHVRLQASLASGKAALPGIQESGPSLAATSILSLVESLASFLHTFATDSTTRLWPTQLVTNHTSVSESRPR